MTTNRKRRLAFELLETKASPSALLLALAPLDESDQRWLEAERAMFAAPTTDAARPTHDANTGLLEFIDQNTRRPSDSPPPWPAPTAAQATAADNMMTVTDSDLRSLLISELLSGTAVEQENVFSVIQY